MAHAAVDLTEWQTLGPDDHEALAGRSLDGRPETCAAVGALARSGALVVDELRRGLRITSRSHVGRVVLSDLTITVRPKVPDMPLAALLRYAYGAHAVARHRPIAQGTDANGIQELLVWQLAAEAAHLIAAGLHRRYTRRHDDLRGPRGRLDIAALARRGAVATDSLPCIHHPRTADCLVNQVLLAGLMLASTLTSDPALRSELQGLASVLRDIVSTIPLNAGTFPRLAGAMDRLVDAYRPALQLVRLLAESRGIDLHGHDQLTVVPGFMFDMNRFFQALMSRYLADNLPDHVVRGEYQMHDMLRYELNPAHRCAPSVRPDFVVHKGGERVATLDAKYRDLWATDVPSGWLYQLTIYAMSQPTTETAAILYPTMADAASEAVVAVGDPAGDGLRARVSLRPVHLARLAALVSADGHEVSMARAANAKGLAGLA